LARPSDLVDEPLLVNAVLASGPPICCRVTTQSFLIEE
jgi:hypothetical protein